MNKYKPLILVLLCFSFVVLTSGLAFADCTKQVVNADGTKTITTACASTKTEASDNFWNRYLFTSLEKNLQDSIRWQMQNIQDQLAKIFSAQQHSKQVAADVKEKEQEMRDAQQEKQQQQQIQIDNLKDQQAMQREQQQQSLQDLDSKK